MNSNKKTTSYLSFDQSNAIKGFLIILIILGHNHILAPQGGKLFVYLYKFHIYGFFILPFMYNKSKFFNLKNSINIIIKNWIPYLVFFLLCYSIYHFVVLKNGFNFKEFTYGFINGSASATKQSAGFIFLWFMPAFAAMTILMSLFYNTNNYWTFLIPLVGIVLYFLPKFTFSILFPIIPFAISQGFYYFCFGFFSKLLLDRIPKVEYFGAVLFVFISLLYWFVDLGNTYYLFPVSGFLFVYLIKDVLVRIPFLLIMGKYSFPVYLLHVIIYNILEMKLPKTLFWGSVDFSFTIFLSLLIGYTITKTYFLRKMILPKDLNDVKSIFVK